MEQADTYDEIIGDIEDEARPPINRSRRRPDLDGDNHIEFDPDL